MNARSIPDLIDAGDPDLIYEHIEENITIQDEIGSEKFNDFNKEIRSLKLSHEMELIKLNAKINKQQHWIQLLEDRVGDLERKCEELEKTIRLETENEILILGPKNSDNANKSKVVILFSPI